MKPPTHPAAPLTDLRFKTSCSHMTVDGEALKLMWGDFHNHCSVGLFHHAKGSLERAIDNARCHLDFFAFTGHSQWHDMPKMVNDAHLKWQEGFDHHTALWPKTRKLIKAANKPGRFAAFLGYEWHSAAYGDRCVIFKDDEGELRIMNDLAEVEAYARECGAMLYPHHIGYSQGLPGRGLNWETFDPGLSPIIEIQSEHGCSERDRGPYPYITHSNGPRTTENTYQRGLARGVHCGVAGGSDDHLGFPGAYREGVVGVFAAGLTREDIFSGVWRRRTLASTGDRIGIDFRINDGFIGDILPMAPDRRIRAAVSGWDEIDKVEIIKNSRIIHRAYPPSSSATIGKLRQRFILRFEYGWGPWSAFGMPRTADWKVEIRLKGASITAWQPAFQTAPFDEERRHAVELADNRHVALRSYTSRTGAFLEAPTNALVLEIQAAADDEILLDFSEPEEKHFRYRLGDLFSNSRVGFMADFPCESFLLHRLVPEQDYRISVEFEDSAGPGEGEDHYYVRVTQANNQLGWSSPIWVGAGAQARGRGA
ncbi:MAG: DUF3604 domain-containing protein [Opitutaceae bacterium]